MHGFLAWRVRDLVKQGYPDFTIFYTAGKIVHLGEADYLYDNREQAAVQDTFVAETRIRMGRLPYNHPPFEALLYAPLARTSYQKAFWIWTVFNLVILTVVPILLRPYISLLQRTSLFVSFLGELAFLPVVVALMEGQDTVLLLFCFTCAFVLVQRRSDFLAGCCLGLGMFRFQIVLPFVVILLLTKKFRVVRGWAVMSIVLALVSFIGVSWRGTLAYPTYLWHVQHSMYAHTAMVSYMPNLHGLCEVLLSALVPKTFVDGLTVVFSALLIYFVPRAGLGEDHRLFSPLGFSLSLLASLLVSYHSFIYDLPILLLVMIVSLDHGVRNPRPDRWGRIAWYGPTVLMSLSPLLVFLLLQDGRVSLLAIVLLFWFGSVCDEVRQEGSQPS